jgi:hypothetical protein
MPNEIFINNETYNKLFAYAEIAKKTLDSEIGGYLVIKELDEGGLLVEDILLPEQTVSGGSFKAKPGIKVAPEVIPMIHGFWHSHHNMGTFHSGTDDNTLGDKWNGETRGSASYAVSIVVALPNKIIAYLQYFKPIILEKVEIPISVLHPATKEIYEKCAAEVKERVSKGYTIQKYNYGELFDRGELPEGNGVQPFKEDDDVLLDKETEERIEEEACDAIIDPVTRFSVTQLKEQAMYSPEKFDKDLKLQVESLKRLLREKYTTVTGTQLKLGECPHISLNEKKKPICFLKGRRYDCSKCERNPKNLKKEEKLETCNPFNMIKPCKNPNMNGSCLECEYNVHKSDKPAETPKPIISASEVVSPTSQPQS